MNDAPMSDSLVLDDPHISHLPLTQEHHDELDAVVLEQVEDNLVNPSDYVPMTYSNVNMA